VQCQRGVGGGCWLAEPASEITVARVVRALQGEVLDVPKVSRSATAQMWADAAGALEESLERVTIADLVKRQAEFDFGTAPTYEI